MPPPRHLLVRALRRPPQPPALPQADLADLEDFEDSDLQDRLERARRQTTGRMALMTQIFGQAQDVVTIVSFSIGLLAYAIGSLNGG